MINFYIFFSNFLKILEFLNTIDILLWELLIFTYLNLRTSFLFSPKYYFILSCPLYFTNLLSKGILTLLNCSDNRGFEDIQFSSHCLFWFVPLYSEMAIEFRKELDSQEVMEDEDVTFTCELNKPNQEVTWVFAGKTIRPSKKYEMSSDGCTYTLKINKCALSDTNQVSIKCKTAKSSAQLSVKGKCCK